MNNLLNKNKCNHYPKAFNGSSSYCQKCTDEFRGTHKRIKKNWVQTVFNLEGTMNIINKYYTSNNTMGEKQKTYRRNRFLYHSNGLKYLVIKPIQFLQMGKRPMLGEIFRQKEYNLSWFLMKLLLIFKYIRKYE